MPLVLHGDIQRAFNTADDSGYRVRPHSSGVGWTVWRLKPQAHPIAHFVHLPDAELFVFGQVAILDDPPHRPRPD